MNAAVSTGTMPSFVPSRQDVYRAIREAVQSAPEIRSAPVGSNGVHARSEHAKQDSLLGRCWRPHESKYTVAEFGENAIVGQLSAIPCGPARRAELSDMHEAMLGAGEVNQWLQCFHTDHWVHEPHSSETTPPTSGDFGLLFVTPSQKVDRDSEGFGYWVEKPWGRRWRHFHSESMISAIPRTGSHPRSSRARVMSA